jgi:hypothetical protein
MRKNIFLLSILLILLSSYPIFSQDPIGYQTPPTAMSDLLLAKLVLILANHIGDRQVLRQALDLARSNTIGASA